MMASKKTETAMATPLDPVVTGLVGATLGACARGFQNVI